ncbi:MAG: lysophospholipid acyltransferase family protein [Bdellovibrionota bacterium]
MINNLITTILFTTIIRPTTILLVKVLSILPLKFRIYIGRFGAYILTPFLRRENFFIKLQSKVFFKKEISPYKIYANIAQTFFEAFNLSDIKDENISVYQSEDNILEKVAKNDKATIVLTAHTGNWELLAAYFIKKGFKIATAAKKLEFVVGQEIIEKIRRSYGIKTIWRGGRSGAKEILNEIEKKHVMAVLIDQHTKVSSLDSVFFNHEVKVPSSLIKMAVKHNTNTIVAFNFRRDITHYDFYIHLLKPNLTQEEIAREYNELLEKYIRMYPEQWVWFHKRWRVLNGKDLSRKKYIEHLNDLLAK